MRLIALILTYVAAMICLDACGELDAFFTTQAAAGAEQSDAGVEDLAEPLGRVL